MCSSAKPHSAHSTGEAESLMTANTQAQRPLTAMRGLAKLIRRIFKVIEKYRELFVLHRIGSRDLAKTHDPGASDGVSDGAEER